MNLNFAKLGVRKNHGLLWCYKEQLRDAEALR